MKSRKAKLGEKKIVMEIRVDGNLLDFQTEQRVGFHFWKEIEVKVDET
jgi:hypothetical protein